MTEPVRSHREEMAHAEVGHTDVSPAAARALCLVFLLTVFSVPALQSLRDVLYRGAEEGTRLPQSWDILRTLPPWREIVSVRSPGATYRLLPSAAEIRDFERTLEDRSLLRRSVLPGAQLVLTAGLKAGNEQAYLGRDGWLYYRPSVEYLTGHGFLTPAVRRERASYGQTPERPVTRDPAAAILDFRRQLAARGIALVLLPAPGKAMIHPEALGGAAATRPLQNPSFAAFVAQLLAEGVMIFDPAEGLLASKRATGAAQFLKTDSHWTPAAMTDTARRLAELLAARVPLSAAGRVTFMRKARVVTGHGDLARMLKLPDPARVFPPERVTIETVTTPEGGAWRAAREAEVLLLGDSFSNIYSLGAMGWGEGAGLAEQLSAALGRPVDRIVRNDGGASGTRLELARLLAQGDDRLAHKKVVVWQFAVRELAAAEWKTIDLGPVRTGGEDLTAPPGEDLALAPIVVAATVVAKAAVPDPGSVPYPDCLGAFHLSAIEAEGAAPPGEPIPEQALAYLQTLKDDAWTEAARIEVGARIRLRLRSWSAGEAEYGSLRRSEIDDERALELPAYWGELVR